MKAYLSKVFEQTRGNKFKRLVPLLFLFALLLCVFFLPVAPRLVLTRAKDGKMLLALPIAQQETFQIRYTHSANRSPVVDTIEWTGEVLMVRESLFQTFGAGIPIPADGIGKELIKTDKGYRLTGIDKPQDSFLLMTQEIPDHYLLYRDREISLNALIGIGSILKFEVRKTTLPECILYGA